MKIGTRGSDLARIQTGMIARKIEQSLGVVVEIEVIKTRGDIITDRPLRELEGRGYFTKELEEALLDRRIDLAVHSFKDMPSQNPGGLIVACVSERAVRRESQTKAIRADLVIKDLRGNVTTRLRKLSEGLYDVIFLASAGVRRLNLDLSDFDVVRLEPGNFVPSPGQGALALQMRIEDPNLELVKSVIHNQDSFIATSIERDVMARFGGGCSLPLGAYANSKAGIWYACGFWGGYEGKPVWARVSDENPSKLGEKLFKKLNEKYDE